MTRRDLHRAKIDEPASKNEAFDDHFIKSKEIFAIWQEFLKNRPLFRKPCALRFPLSRCAAALQSRIRADINEPTHMK